MSDKCRFGCNVVETVSHIFFDCTDCLGDISDLTEISQGKALEYNIRNLFTRDSLQLRVELPVFKQGLC